MTLLEGLNPVAALYDQFELFAHKGQETLVNLNVSLGIMHWKDASHHVAVINPGMEHFVITKHVVFMLAAVVLLLVLFGWARLRGATSGAPRGLQKFFEPILLFLRDEIVRPNIKDPHHHHDHGHVHGDHGHGHEHAHGPTHKYADKLLPLFCTFFFFIAGMNLLGLIPGASTPTSAMTVTAGLAVLTLTTYVLGGMLLQKPFFFGFLKNLVPACPLALWPLLFFLEVVGLFVKPVALTIRLAANMTAGHCIILSLAGLAGLAVASSGGAAGFGIGVAASLGAVAIYCLEVFVAILQAYIFTYLSAIFIGSYLVPEH